MAYSFWASMIMRVESWTEAVEGVMPMVWRKDFAADMSGVTRKVIKLGMFLVFGKENGEKSRGLYAILEGWKSYLINIIGPL